VIVDTGMSEPLPLQPLLGDWPSAALSCLERESAIVRVIVANVRGSAPREPGACMLVDSRGVTGTIGGGHLEQEAIVMARSQLTQTAGANPILTCRMTLGRDLAQCCGGAVDLWLERLTQQDRSWLSAAANRARAGSATLITRATRGTPDRSCRMANADEQLERIRFESSDEGFPGLRERIDAPMTPLWLYGAGHVGRAVVRALEELPFRVTWIDSRPGLLPAAVPANARAQYAEDPVATAHRAPPSAYHLIMTHDHGIDFDLCHAILVRNEFSWLGLIGSASKAAKFRSRLAREGVSSERITRLVCPIGIGGITSKLPAAIAATVTVQLLQELEHAAERALFSRAPMHDDCPAGDCKSCRERQGAYR